MKPVFNLRLTAWGVALLCVAGASSALTLGRARSVVLLGQPLELTVPVQFGADEDASAPCFDADVFYGDNRQDRSRVSITTQASAPSQTAQVRVHAQAGVDEPVVTVYFRAGCDHKTTRRYVLLADLATEVETPAVASPAVRTLAPTATPLKTRVAEPKLAGDAVGAPSHRETAVPRRKPKAQAPTPPAPTVALAKPSVPTPSMRMPSARQRARLKLTPLELGAERDPVLRSTDLLMDLPIEDLEKRTQAVATWRALNATPEDILRQDARASSMEGDVKGLRDLTEKNQKLLLDLAGRLETAQAQRYNNPLVHALVAGLLASLAGIGFILWRLRGNQVNATPWWRSPNAAQRADATVTEDRAVTNASVQPKSDRPLATGLPSGARVPLQDPAADMSGVDIDLEVRDSEYGRLVQAHAPERAVPQVVDVPVDVPAAAHGHRDFSHSVNATLRAINTQEMLDVRQQADFFMTLGQHEEAIELLEESILHSVDSNPLVYLDLLKIFHTLSRKAEYERYRSGFNALFSGRVPAYAYFFQQSHGLDAYEDVCQHIASLWPSEAALYFIEQCLVRSHDTLLVQEFDLDAFRDLLTLHGVLRRLLSSTDSGLVPFSTFKPQALTQNATPVPGGAGHSTFTPDQTMPVYPSVGAEMGVDVDLSEPAAKNLLEFEDVGLSLAPLDGATKRP